MPPKAKSPAQVTAFVLAFTVLALVESIVAPEFNVIGDEPAAVVLLKLSVPLTEIVPLVVFTPASVSVLPAETIVEPP